jgi:PAS domain S-box-containing protein
MTIKVMLKIREYLTSTHTLLVLMAILTVLVAAAYNIYFERSGRERVEGQLESISQLKVAELVQWRRERLGDGDVFHANSSFIELLESYAADYKATDARLRVITWLRQIRESYAYDKVFLFDASGTELAAWPIEGTGDPMIASAIRSTPSLAKTDFLDFYKNPSDGRVYLSVLAPLKGALADWVLALRIDPEKYLYPYLKRWPVESGSAETLLVRKDGDDVLYLNPLRFRQEKALELRVPLDANSSRAPARAVLGHSGIFLGKDYRGIPVLSALAHVDNSPWYLITRMDLEEVHGDTRDRRFIMAILMLALLGAEATGVLATTRRFKLRSLEKEAQASKTVKASEERLRLALSAADQGLYDLNVQTGQTVVNDTYALMLGYDPEEFRETNAFWIERLHPDDKESVAETYRSYIAGEIPDYRVEFRQKAKDGAWKWILSLGKIVERNAEGLPLRMLGTHTDITARKTAEEALRTSETRLRRTLDEMMEGCQIISCGWRYLYLNDTAVRYSRSRKEDLLGKTLFECYPGVEDTELFKVLDSCMRARSSATTESEFRYPDGTQEWFEFSIQPTFDGLFILTLNISDRKRHEQELLDLNRSLEQKVEERTAILQVKNRELEAFTYSVAHDLRSPLRGIDGFSRIVQEEYAEALGSEGGRLLGIIRSGAAKLDSLITNLLEYARIGRSLPTLSELDMEALARSAFGNCADPAVLDSFQISIGEMPKAIADPGMMERIWTNLLSNAVKYSIPAPIHRIELEGHKAKGTVEYVVRDHGVGFDPRYGDKLFVMFQRLHAEESFPGSGIGLAIVRKLVELHGGKIWAEGTPGKGATFSFALPDRSMP